MIIQKVLLIEDDPIDQMAFQRFVKMEKIELEYDIAGSVAEAKQKLSNNTYGIIITDYNLGDGNAFDILALGYKIPLIFTSGVGDEEVIVNAMKKGASDYLIKDIARNYLKVLPLTIEKTIRRYNAEKRLAAVEEELKKLSIVASKTSNSVIIFNKDLEIEWVNEAFSKLSGYTFLEVKGNDGTLVREGNDNLFESKEIHDKVLLQKESYSYENRNSTKEGKIYWALTTLTPILDLDGEIDKVIAIESDISSNKAAEEQLIYAKEKAEESKKIKEEFLANMSHEIRTPLNGIKGFTDLLMKDKYYPEQEKYLDAIKFSTDNLLAIINDILDFSKIEAGKLQLEQTNFYFRDLITSIINSFRFNIEEKGIEISKTIDDNIPENLIGDPVRINQVITNLVGNAIKFTEKGNITISAKSLSITDENIELEFKISDTGIGIPSDKLEDIFNSFSQASSSTTRKYGGTGLGLAIVKKIVSLHNGDIKAESELGKGSTFIFNINLEIDSDQTIIQKHDNMHKEIDLTGLRVLVAEDYPMNQLLINETLSRWGIEFDIVENGKLAINRLKEHDFDLILMDVNMPVMSGLEATQIIRNDFDNPKNIIPIIAMTAGALKGDREKCESAGMNDYITKPFDQDELFIKIARYVDKNAKKTLNMN